MIEYVNSHKEIFILIIILILGLFTIICSNYSD